MPASIFGDRFLGRREPAWHGLGQVFDQNRKLSVSEGFIEAGLDYDYVKAPLFFRLDEGGEEFASDRVAIVRSAHRDDPAHLIGTAHKDRGIIQNMTLAEILNPLGSKWPLETVGALGEGETIFVTLDAGTVKVAGEDVQRYYLVTDSKAQDKALQAAYTPVRVVCQNTLISGLRAATMSTTLPHISSVQETFAWHVKLLDSLAHAADETDAAFEGMALVKLVESQVADILAAAYPMPKESKSLAMARALIGNDAAISMGAAQMFSDRQMKFESEKHGVEDKRDLATLAWTTINDQHPLIAGSAYALYNAVVECEDYRVGRDEVQMSALVGNRALTKTRAFKACYDLAQN